MHQIPVATNGGSAIPTVTSTEPKPRDRGYAFGLARREQISLTLAVYRRLLSEAAGIGAGELGQMGVNVSRQFEGRWPDLVDELEGLATGAGVDVAELLAINARTELLAGRAGAECSVAGYVQTQPHRPHCIVGENWDWHPDLAGARVTWIVSGVPSGWFISLTEAGMLAKIGMNAGGLCCALNALTSSADGGTSGVPIHVLLRLLLDRCGTLGEALELLASVTLSASACITLASVEEAGAALVSVELSPGGLNVIWADDGGRLSHTNHFLRAPGAGVDREWRERPGTLARLWTVHQALLAAPRPLTVERLSSMLRSHFAGPESVCRHAVAEAPWHERRETLASVIMDPGAGRFLLADGPPCARPYVDVPVPLHRGRAARAGSRPRAPWTWG